MKPNPKKRCYSNILEAIGWTPLVKLNKVAKDIPGEVYAKVEFFNPGGSVKDRIGIAMIEKAEQENKIKPGGVIIEGTSGNTGIGLAIACAIKGYKLICTTTDKQSREKINTLKAFGAEVIVCPTNVPPEDPRSYYSVAKKLSESIPNSIYVNQYDNPANQKAHYETTGPEIWEQTDGKITHLVAGVGTGGTISGSGRFLKEKNPAIKIWGADPYGSVLKKYKDTNKYDPTEAYPYLIEGIGEDIIPKNVDFSIIDDFEKVSDKEAAIWARKITKLEGIFVGYSSGAAFAALYKRKHLLNKDSLVVVIFPDNGFRNLNKIYNDEWMREHRFLQIDMITAADIINLKEYKLISSSLNETIAEAYNKMKRENISQLPVFENDNPIGMLYDWMIFEAIENNPQIINSPVKSLKLPSPIIVSEYSPLPELTQKIKEAKGAILVKDSLQRYHIITSYDIIEIANLTW